MQKEKKSFIFVAALCWVAVTYASFFVFAGMFMCITYYKFFFVMISAVSAFKARYICKYHIAEKKHDQWPFKFVMNVFFNVCLWFTSGNIAVVILPHSGSHLESIRKIEYENLFKGTNIINFNRFFSMTDSHPKNVVFQVSRRRISYMYSWYFVGSVFDFFPKFVKRSIDYLCHKFYLQKGIYKLKTYLRSLLFFLSHLFVLYLFRLSISFALVPKKRTKYIEHF